MLVKYVGHFTWPMLEIQYDPYIWNSVGHTHADSDKRFFENSAKSKLRTLSLAVGPLIETVSLAQQTSTFNLTSEAHDWMWFYQKRLKKLSHISDSSVSRQSARLTSTVLRHIVGTYESDRSFRLSKFLTQMVRSVSVKVTLS